MLYQSSNSGHVKLKLPTVPMEKPKYMLHGKRETGVYHQPTPKLPLRNRYQ